MENTADAVLVLAFTINLWSLWFATVGLSSLVDAIRKGGQK
jgi:hypothetical protein